MESIPISEPPQLFLCNKCKVYFFSVSKLTKPTHSKCTGHDTRLALDTEIDAINKANGLHLAYNRGNKQ